VLAATHLSFIGLFHPTRFVVVFVQPRWILAWFQDLGLGLEIGSIYGFGTVYRLPCVVVTLNWVNSNDCWWRTCLRLLIWRQS